MIPKPSEACLKFKKAFFGMTSLTRDRKLREWEFFRVFLLANRFSFQKIDDGIMLDWAKECCDNGNCEQAIRNKLATISQMCLQYKAWEVLDPELLHSNIHRFKV